MEPKEVIVKRDVPKIQAKVEDLVSTEMQWMWCYLSAFVTLNITVACVT